MSKRIRSGGAAALIAAFGGPGVQAAEPIVLAPSSKWVLDYADNSCRLLRTFGTDDRQALLFLTQGAPGVSFGLTAAGPQFNRFNDGRETLISVADDRDERETKPFQGSVDSVGSALIYSSLNLDYLLDGNWEDEEEEAGAALAPGLPSMDADSAAKMEFIEFRQGGRRVRFATGNMREPIAALNKCSADLVRAWGLDLDQHLTATRLPAWSNRDEVVRRIVTYYPGEAKVRGTQGIIQMRVMIDADGNVTDCQLERMTSAESLVSRACQEMQRANFEPALDSAGKPMKSFYSTKIVYKMAR